MSWPYLYGDVVLEAVVACFLGHSTPQRSVSRTLLTESLMYAPFRSGDLALVFRVTFHALPCTSSRQVYDGLRTRRNTSPESASEDAALQYQASGRCLCS